MILKLSGVISCALLFNLSSLEFEFDELPFRSMHAINLSLGPTMKIQAIRNYYLFILTLSQIPLELELCPLLNSSYVKYRNYLMHGFSVYTS